MKKSKLNFVLIIFLLSFSNLLSQKIDEYTFNSCYNNSFYDDIFTLTSRIDSVKMFTDKWERYYFTYDSTGHIIKSSSIYFRSIKHMQTFFYYDSLYNLIQKRKEIFKDNKWINNKEETYTYMPNGNIKSWVLRKWEDSLWINVERRLFNYNQNGNITLYSEEQWVDNSWIIQMRNTYDYNDEGKKTLFINERKIIVGDLENNIKESYEYDSNNNLILFYKANWWGQQWVTYIKKSLIYDDNNNITEEIWKERVDTALVNYWKSEYTYDENQNKVSALFKKWKDNKWIFANRILFDYDSDGNIIARLKENWNHNQWENDRREKMIYNSAGYKKYHLTELWETNHWENSNQKKYNFGLNNNLISYSNEFWYENRWNKSLFNIFLFDSLGNKYRFHSGKSIRLYYNVATDIKEDGSNDIKTEYCLSQNYPNPFNPTTTISYSLPQSGFVQLKVYNLLGQEVMVLVNKEQLSGNYKVEFDASKLTSGIYLYRIQSGNFIETKKMILLR